MRYQFHPDNSLANYWEQIISVWWQRIPRKTGRFLAYFFREMLLANLILLYELTVNQPFHTLRQNIVLAMSHVHILAAVKRIIDLIGAIVGFILSMSIWVFVPIAIALDSPGPVFYTQERVGINRRHRTRRSANLERINRRFRSERRNLPGYGKTFTIIKFRSMRIDAEKTCGPVWATKNDDRVTRVGRILRATRLDEVPQLINVLIGDMSLVGPRPERPFFVNDLKDKVQGYSSRFEVKPGITGLAQVEHKYDESVEDVTKKISFDLRYISSLSIFQDIKIILKTIIVVFTMRGM